MIKSGFIKSEKFFFFFLLILVIVIKLPTMNLDYHWDAAFTASQAKYYSVNGLFSIPPGSIVHVPFFTWTVAFFYRILGESPFLSHFVVAIFSFIGVYFTYLLGKLLYSKRVGVIASLLLLFSPIYFAISGQMLFDVPLTAMTMITLYFGLKKKIIFYLISGSILILTKEPGILTILALVIYQFIKREKFYNIVVYSLPVIFLIIWLGWYQIKTGYFLSAGFEASQQSFILKMGKGISSIYQMFFWNYNWLLSTFILLAFFKNGFNKKMKNLIPFGLMVVFYLGSFSFFSLPFIPRYLLPVYPILFLISAHSMNYIFKNKLWLILILILLLFISTYKWNSGIKEFIQDPVFHSDIFLKKTIASVLNGELSLDYTDTLESEKNSIGYISSNYPNSTTVYLAKEAIEYIFVDNESKIDIGYRHNLMLPTKENFDEADFVLYRLDCLSCPHMDIYNNILPKMQLLKTFDENVYVYRILR